MSCRLYFQSRSLVRVEYNVYNIELIKDSEPYPDYLYKHISEINNEIARGTKYSLPTIGDGFWTITK